MEDTTALTFYIYGQEQGITPTIAEPLSPLDLAISAWLDAKFKHTHSTRTLSTYRDILMQFRAALQRAGLDLDMLHTQADRDRVKQIAQAFASFSARGRAVALATINNRYAVLSSFYVDCIKHERAGITYETSSLKTSCTWTKLLAAKSALRRKSCPPFYLSCLSDTFIHDT